MNTQPFTPKSICNKCERIVVDYCAFCGIVCPPAPARMVPVPAGPVLLGSSEEDLSVLALGMKADPEIFAREALQEVNLPHAVYVDRFSVTVAQFYEFALRLSPAERIALGVGELREPAEKTRDFPATNVSWVAAVRYAHSQQKRLLTEAEYEKAAGFDPATFVKYIFPWGNLDDPSSARCNRSGELVAVHQHEVDGASALGACDMVGNALEWCADPFEDSYHFRLYNELNIDPANPPTSGLRTVRGGSCKGSPLECRVAWRHGQPADKPQPLTGFRCAKDIR